MFIQSFPDEIDLLAFFEGEPIFQNTEDLHFAYKSNRKMDEYEYSIQSGRRANDNPTWAR